MYEFAEDGPTVVLATTGRPPLRLVLSAEQRPWRDSIGEYLVTLTGEGLEAKALVTTLEGDSLAEYFGGIAARFRGWAGVLEWSSVEGQLRAEARWLSGGRVMLCFRLRPEVYDTTWEVSVVFDLDAGAEMQALSAEVFHFFAAN